jgi:hypothetical protein
MAILDPGQVPCYGSLVTSNGTLVVRCSRIPTTMFSRHAPHTRARGLQVRSYEARHVRNRYVVVGRGLLLAKCAEEVAPVVVSRCATHYTIVYVPKVRS